MSAIDGCKTGVNVCGNGGKWRAKKNFVHFRRSAFGVCVVGARRIGRRQCGKSPAAIIDNSKDNRAVVEGGTKFPQLSKHGE